MNTRPNNDPITKFIRKKRILSLAFSLSMAVPFFIFVFIMAFKPEWLSYSFHHHVNAGLWSSFGLIILMFILIWSFVKWKITHDGSRPQQVDGDRKDD